MMINGSNPNLPISRAYAGGPLEVPESSSDKISNGIRPSTADDEAASSPWGSDRVELSSAALDGISLNNSWRDVFEIHGPRGRVRTVCSETAPIAGPGEVIRAVPGQSVGPAGSPLCR